MKYLVEKCKVDINERREKDNFTALMASATLEDDVILKYLIEEAGADINIVDKDNFGVLGQKLANGELDMVKYLVEEK